MEPTEKSKRIYIAFAMKHSAAYYIVALMKKPKTLPQKKNARKLDGFKQRVRETQRFKSVAVNISSTEKTSQQDEILHFESTQYTIAKSTTSSTQPMLKLKKWDCKPHQKKRFRTVLCSQKNHLQETQQNSSISPKF